MGKPEWEYSIFPLLALVLLCWSSPLPILHKVSDDLQHVPLNFCITGRGNDPDFGLVKQEDIPLGLLLPLLGGATLVWWHLYILWDK